MASEFLYVIDPEKKIYWCKKTIEIVVKKSIVLTFDTTYYNKLEEDLIIYMIKRYPYVREKGRIYIKENNINLFKDIISFCNNCNDARCLLLYSKNIKNNLLASDKQNFLFIRLYNK